jgi:hypothetical protein
VLDQAPVNRRFKLGAGFVIHDGILRCSEG